MFYDGDCPLCRREIRLLRRLDRHGRIGFIDIAEPSFDPTTVGLSWQTLMDRIHGRVPDGTMIEGVEVFRRLYAAVGLGPLVAITRWVGISHLLEAAYGIFAKHRLRLTGRCTAGTCDVAGARKFEKG